MTEHENGEEILCRFFVPYETKDGEWIPKKKREAFLEKVEKAACRLNGGFTSYEAHGGYLADDGKIVKEKVTVIETYGKNPFTDKELFLGTDDLAQECTIVMEGGSFQLYNYKALPPGWARRIRRQKDEFYERVGAYMAEGLPTPDDKANPY